MFGSNRTSRPAPAHPVKLTKDPAGAPAINISKVREAGHIELAKRADKAGLALSKKGLNGIRAQAVLVLDHSGSMLNDYSNGKVQTLVERVLGFSLQIDVDGTVPVVPFDHRVLPTVEVTVDTYRDVVNRKIWRGMGDMGSTRLHEALRVVRDMAVITDAPLFCAVVTDGNPDSRPPTTDIVVDLARYPVFLKFIAIREVPYLQELDDLPADRRLLDNVDAKFFNDPSAVSDLEFADALADEWDTWISAAQRAGVVQGA
ncbi:VWA domain-containing protein [Micromonospora sp. RV43]|uniref:VWA domain-containing protein n=1 Tax=Micromonospora sp. RV43 TaxID=1661387 RepID=UPI00069FF307|nr:VWA domain-containing protein [Micromonospora sp. RV43]